MRKNLICDRRRVYSPFNFQAIEGKFTDFPMKEIFNLHGAAGSLHVEYSSRNCLTYEASDARADFSRVENLGPSSMYVFAKLMTDIILQNFASTIGVLQSLLAEY